MQNFKSKIATIAIAIFLTFSMTASMMLIPITSAHTPAWNIPTYAYVTCSPSTVGVGQYTQIVFWLDKFPPTAGGVGGDRWHGYLLTITQPDGTNVTEGPYTCLSQVASMYISFTPTEVGNYTIVFSWPGQVLTNGTGVPDSAGVSYVGDNFKAATSAPTTLTVQQAPITGWVENQLPSTTDSYWTLPVSTTNRVWSQLVSNDPLGSWFRYTNNQESGTSPNSAHILYAIPLTSGGSADARYGAIKFDINNYNSYLSPNPIIMNGVIYVDAEQDPRYGYTAYNLLTGQEMWYKNGTDNGLSSNTFVLALTGGGGGSGPALTQKFPELSFGQMLHYDNINGGGVIDYLWMTLSNATATAAGITNWYMLDANTGNWILTLTGVPSGTSVTDQNGDELLYTYTAATGNFLCWNSSQAIPTAGPTGTSQSQWKPMVGATINATYDTIWTQYGPSPASYVAGTGWGAADIVPLTGYTMNFTGPVGLPPLAKVLQDSNYVPQMMFFDNLNNLPTFGAYDSSPIQIAAVQITQPGGYSPYPNEPDTQNSNLGYTCSLLYNLSIARPMTGNLTFSIGPISYENQVFTLYSKETRQWWGYSLTTGALLWGPTASQGVWDMYGSDAAYGNGILFSGGYAGVLHAYNITTGQQLWSYTLQPIGYESPYGNYQCTFGVINDGKIFVYSMEHSPSEPTWRGSYLRCINITDGTLIWKCLDFVSGFSGGNGWVGVADGIIVTGNDYDNRLYAFGEGASATTVSTVTTPATVGTQQLITGTVTDQSPGTTCLGYPAKGTPAISDASQEAWMEYLYEQQAEPLNATGVPVTLTYVDPNNNIGTIGTATSDITGQYTYAFTPAVPGTYTIIATFCGTNSYYSSTAETHLLSVAATAATSAPTATPTSIADMYFVPAIAGLFVVIIVVAIVLALLMLRKKP